MLTGTARGILCTWIKDAREYNKCAIIHRAEGCGNKQTYF
jgi:hypothetical protein